MFEINGYNWYSIAFASRKFAISTSTLYDLCRKAKVIMLERASFPAGMQLKYLIREDSLLRMQRKIFT